MLPALGLLTLALAAAPGSDLEIPKTLPPPRTLDLAGKLLLCQPQVIGAPAKARLEAFARAAQRHQDRLFEYGNL